MTGSWKHVENYKGYGIQIKHLEEFEGKMGMPSLPEAYRMKITHQRHRAAREFPVHTGNREEAVRHARMMVDWIHGAEPKYNIGDIVVDDQGRTGTVKHIKFYNNPFAKELPVPEGKYEPKFAYHTESDYSSTGKLIMLERSIVRKHP